MSDEDSQLQNYPKKKANKSSLNHSKTSNEIFECGLCEKTFFDKKEMWEHRKTHTLQCEFCSIFCKDTWTLIIHRRGHTGKKPFKCEVCNKSFAAKNKLNEHARIHDKKLFQCEFCPK